MTEHEASRTLVKSPPELWAECSEADSLARHLNGSFGEIKITRLEPETAVAWEGERASGTVRIEPSGWGTRVTLTAQMEAQAAAEPEPSPEPEAEAVAEESVAEEPEPAPAPDPPPVAVEVAPAPSAQDRRAGWFVRMRSLFRPEALPDPAPSLSPPKSVPPEPEPEPEPVPEPAAATAVEPEPGPVQTEPAAVEPEPCPREPEPEPVQEPDVDAEQILAGALESLGQAHHRPFSRS